VIRLAIEVNGIVQGVGFRPNVYRIVQNFGLTGFVQNTSEGVHIEIQGDKEKCYSAQRLICSEKPAGARIKKVTASEMQLIVSEQGFQIVPSTSGTPDTLVSPDLGICKDCTEDILNPENRRYRYPFTNCTNCGPRFSIVREIPYDRKNTVMSGFKMCSRCKKEYEDPMNRRFHAQPNACSDCGPHAFYIENGIENSDWEGSAVKAINSGRIVAVKGLGGYCLACDAHNSVAVDTLRARKHREARPFALMARDVQSVMKYAYADPEEIKLLESSEKPVVLLKKREGCKLPENIAPGIERLGFMLPYTPLHLLLMTHFDVLIMTSCNYSGGTMAFRGDEHSLNLADGILDSNRPIERRVDDSVVFLCMNEERFIRRARGYVPAPIRIKSEHNLLALGGQEKNTFCLTRGNDAFLSGYIGDLADKTAIAAMRSEIPALENLFGVKPEAIICDMHPDYASSRIAPEFGLPVIKVQHHMAHFASVLSENHTVKKAAGIIYDGTGYGTDNNIWGAEMFTGNLQSMIRVGHMKYARMPGGEAAIAEPWRMALSMISEAEGSCAASEYFKDRKKESDVILKMSERKINSPDCSSMGRLFDAVAAITGICERSSYDGQAACELEGTLDENAEGEYIFDINDENGMLIFDWRKVISDILRDLSKGTSYGKVSAKFHRAVVTLTVNLGIMVCRKYCINDIALSGGVFQNQYLLKNCSEGLEKAGFNVLLNSQVPANDGGISYGQAAMGAAVMGKRKDR
jgi:hydrogenase maturation protein HypF